MLKLLLVIGVFFGALALLVIPLIGEILKLRPRNTKKIWRLFVATVFFLTAYYTFLLWNETWNWVGL